MLLFCACRPAEDTLHVPWFSKLGTESIANSQMENCMSSLRPQILVN